MGNVLYATWTSEMLSVWGWTECQEAVVQRCIGFINHVLFLHHIKTPHGLALFWADLGIAVVTVGLLDGALPNSRSAPFLFCQTVRPVLLAEQLSIDGENHV